MDPSSSSLKDSVRAPSSSSSSSSSAAGKPIRLTALKPDDSSSNMTTAPKETSAVAGHTSHVPTPPSSAGTTTTRKEEEEDNAPLVGSVSASGSTHTTDNSGLVPQLPPPGAASSSSSSSASSSSNQLTQHEQQQVEQYKDDIMLHTQLQLQLYLEDLEEAETAAEIQAHIDHAAFAESLANSANAFDPLQDSLLPGGYHGFAGESPGPLSPDATQIFQQQMMSLESNALAAAAAADATTPFQLGGGGIGAGGGGLGGGGNAIGGGGGQEEHAHDGLDLDWTEMDEDDEDCLPPSETKYILYDDHVSPVTMAQALALLNDPLHEDLVVHVHSNNSNHYTHDSQDDSRQSLLMLGGDGDDWGTYPIYSTPPPLPHASSFSAFFSDTRKDMKFNAVVGSTPWKVNHTGYPHEGGIDDNYHPWEHEEISRTGHSHTMGLPSPPTASVASKSLQAGFFENDNQHHLQDEQQRFKGDNVCTPLTNDNGCDEEGNCEEENQQGRPSHRRGPDIYLNLAGTIISPINIHDIFFSQFYSRLVYLNLWDTNLGIWGAQAVGGLMADRVCRIQYLNLGSNRLGFEGIMQLAGLYKNQSLIELDLSENQLGPKAIHSLQQTMVRLQKDKACNIRRLNLSNNDINDVGCISIAKIIFGTSIVQLDLSFNKISDWGASTILAAFESNELTLKEINMEANPLTFAGGVDLCKILVLPQSRITHLDLRGAKVTDVGVPYLAEALKSHHCPVVSLNLYDCQLTDTGILKLAIKLSVNRSLRVLGLGRNCVGDMGILALSQGLCLNSYLEELDLSENEVEFSRAGLEAMMTAMRTNTSLLHLTLTVERDHHLMAGNQGTGLYMDLPFHQQHEQQFYQNAAAVAVETQYYPQLEELPTFNEPITSTQVGEVLAPTYAALALPLQVPANAPIDAHTPTVTATTLTPPPPPPPPSLPVLPPAPVTAAAQEESLARERHQAARAQMSLKSYVRHNYKRTGNMRKLCFEILAVARVLMFAKEDPQYRFATTTSVQRESEAGLAIAVRPTTMELTLGAGAGNNNNTIISSPEMISDTISTPSLISLQTGLPTPPLATDSKAPTIADPRHSLPSTEAVEDVPQQEQLEQQQQRGSLAALPWELKEMILRGLDPEGLLSERQFQSVMNYAATRWETVRQPWERWGEIREMILEKTSCYYYDA
ncbi:NACHT, LRR and PYD domains-containing protein 3 [Linnemannia schmuckeri]|uniref:NACHT, LRR and PYD domains-containing protein 3 n=1 Tax=Linnemannia schmuckeri TaxID=64567 RepID=A0A9P5V993_9FUNG|nr:NACHT, LRR and PYD domains-containing protein 3 [Linnemannia schmuckeri]